MTLMFLADYGRFFARLGWDVHVISSSGELLEEFARRVDGRIHPLGIARRVEPLTDLRALGKLVGLMRRERFDVVHAVSPKGGLLGMSAARLAGIPTRIYQILGLPSETARGLTRHLLEWSDRTACMAATTRLCVSESLRQRLTERGVAANGQIAVLGDGSVAGIDAETVWNPARVDEGVRARLQRDLGLRAGVPVIGFVGRLEREKGIVELLHAHSALRRKMPEVHLLIAGGFEARGLIPQDALALLQAGDGICWLPRHITDAAEMAALYSLFDVIALPSFREGLPTVLLEAAAMGIPAVATKVTGCVDVVRDGVTGRLVALGDVDQLTLALGDYLADPDLRARHGAAAREHVTANFRVQPMLEAMARLYESGSH